MPDRIAFDDRPFRIAQGRATPPLVLATPHSGRDYPPAFLAQTRLTIAQLRRAEDAFVDELLADATALGVPTLMARYGRAYLDLNREPTELDPAMFVSALAPSPHQASERVAAGLGVLPRIAGHGLDIYAARLRPEDAAARVAAIHAPYHAELAAMLARARAANGHAILLDCHSMPTPPGMPGRTPQFVIGDLHGRSASPGLVAAVERALAVAGWRVARNIPYAGGYTTLRHADVPNGVEVVQIEIDRALYMDPSRLQRHAGFAAIRRTLAALAESLLARNASREAAE